MHIATAVICADVCVCALRQVYGGYRACAQADGPRLVHRVGCECLTAEVLAALPFLRSSLPRARVAQKEWALTSFAERRRVLACLQRYILDHQEDIARVASRDSGKSRECSALLPCAQRAANVLAELPGLPCFDFLGISRKGVPGTETWLLWSGVGRRDAAGSFFESCC